MSRLINIDNKNFYEFNKNPTKTKARLKEIKALGLVEVAEAEFGIPNKMSGLYIERVWNMNNNDWEGYIAWIKTF